MSPILDTDRLIRPTTNTKGRPMTDHDWLELLMVLLAFLAQRLSR